jgi:hypothetical protein
MSNIGTITACFAACWPRDGSPPPDEPAADVASRGADATGRGARYQQNYKEVERLFGVIRSTVSVRYTR